MVGRVFMHEDGALIHLTFDVNLVIASGFKQYQIALVEGANIQIVVFILGCGWYGLRVGRLGGIGGDEII